MIYWPRIVEIIIEWSHQHVTSTLFLCWAVRRSRRSMAWRSRPTAKPPGSIVTTVSTSTSRCCGFDDEFVAPTPLRGVRRGSHPCPHRSADLRRVRRGGVHLAATKDCRRVFVTGHPEYDALTLDGEYRRDLAAGLPVVRSTTTRQRPGPDPAPTWRSHGHLLFSNWLNYYVYQLTSYRVEDIGKVFTYQQPKGAVTPSVGPDQPPSPGVEPVAVAGQGEARGRLARMQAMASCWGWPGSSAAGAAASPVRPLPRGSEWPGWRPSRSRVSSSATPWARPASKASSGAWSSATGRWNQPMPLASTCEPSVPMPRSASSACVIRVSTPAGTGQLQLGQSLFHGDLLAAGAGVSNSWPSRRNTSRLQKRVGTEHGGLVVAGIGIGGWHGLPLGCGTA